METKSNEVTRFLWYIYNKWNLDEAIKLFGTNLGAHIYHKRNKMREQGFDTLYWYGELDEDCHQKLVDRANEIYANA